MRFCTRLFLWLLRLYPRAYRERYGAEMETFHRQELASGEGGVGYGVRLMVDHVRAAAGVWRGGGDGMMRRTLDDLAAGLQALRRAPTFTLFAVLTLALGIGATTAVFTVLDRVVLRPLPYPGSERMALVGIDPRHSPGDVGPLSVPLMLRLQADGGPAEAVVAATARSSVLHDQGEPQRIMVTRVTQGFFPFFGAIPVAGRLFRDDDHGAARVVVLGNGFWRDRYGGDPEMVGRTLRLDDGAYTVVGVLGPDFVAPPEVISEGEGGLFVPLSMDEKSASRGNFFLAGVARLRPGASLEELDRRMDEVVSDAFGGALPNFIIGGSVAPFRDTVVGSLGSMVGRVMAAVALLLIIACVNVASLLLTRGAQRAQELAVRSALGAGRWRLVRQLLSESLVLAVLGAGAGVALAYGSVELFRRHAPAGLPRMAEVAVDARGLGFALAVALGTVFLFGLMPALRATGRARGGWAPGRRTTSTRREGRLRGGLIAVETALAVVLAVGSGLLANDLIRMARESRGFRAEGVLAMQLNLAPRFGSDEWVATWERLLEGARGLPGVTAASLSTQAPYTGTPGAGIYRPEGWDAPAGEFSVVVALSGDYVRTVGASLVAGRMFTADEAAEGGPPVAVVNQAFVKKFWPGEDGVGKHVQSGGAGAEDEPNYEVVGVLADVRTRAGREPEPHLFLPIPEMPWREMELLLHTDGEAVSLVPGVRGLVQRLDPELPISSIRTLESLAYQARSRPRFYTFLFGGFAGVALLLAVVGVYGTTSYATRSRMREIGIRLALGARKERVVGGVVLRTGAVVAAGVALGLVAAALAARFMTDVLTYVTPRDVATYGAVGLVVLMSGLVAAWVPAGRAGRVDPATTLREE